jgi:hypothetical protein
MGFVSSALSSNNNPTRHNTPLLMNQGNPIKRTSEITGNQSVNNLLSTSKQSQPTFHLESMEIPHLRQDLLLPSSTVKPLSGAPSSSELGTGSLIEDTFGLLGLINVIKMTNEDASTLALGKLYKNF